MDTSELPSGFEPANMRQVDASTNVPHFRANQERTDGRDRHGNRLYKTSGEREADNKTQTYLVSQEGEELLHKFPTLPQTIKKGIAYIESVDDPSTLTESFDLGDGWKIEYIGKGGQSLVARLTHSDGTQLVVKIKNKNDERSKIVSQPYVNEMLQGQALEMDMQEELLAAGVTLPTYYMANEEMICTQYIDSTTNPTELHIDHTTLFAQVNEYINAHRDDPLWTGITADSWNTEAEPWQRNFLQQPDGTIVWIDPFVYEPSVAEMQSPKFIPTGFESVISRSFKHLWPEPYLLPPNKEDQVDMLDQTSFSGLAAKYKALREGSDLAMGNMTQEPRATEESFDSNHDRYVQKHASELPPNPEVSPAIGVVVRSYMELSNGNLTQLLESASRVESPAGTFEMIVVVNNPRLYAYAAEAMRNLGIPLDTPPTLEQQRQIADYIERQVAEYNAKQPEDKRVELSRFERDYLAKLRREANPSFIRHIAAYTENQATLAALRVMSQAVEERRKGAGPETITQAQRQIETILQTQTSLSETQRQSFVAAAGHVMEKGIMVIGLDCSSSEKGFTKVDLGLASDEGCHIAVERGAKVLYPIDADFLLSNDGFSEVTEHLAASSGQAEVFYLPLQVYGFQHPEQMADSQSTYLSMLTFYRDIYFYRRRQYGDYISGTRSTGKIMFTAEAFRKIGGYAHGDWTEDFNTSNALEREDIEQHYLTRSFQVLSHRGREESYDGRGLGTEVTTSQDKYLQETQEAREKTVGSLRDLESQVRAILSENPDDPLLTEFRQLYEDLSDAYFQEEQKTREWIRRVFLGVDSQGKPIEGEGTFIKVLDSYQQFRNANPDAPVDPSIIHHIIEDTVAAYQDNPEKQRLIAAFFERNPLMVYALIRQIDTLRAKTGRDVTPEELISALEEDAPEMFARPTTERPTATSPIDHTPVTDWGHVFMATQNVAAAALNYIRDHPDMPVEQRERLERIISLAKGRGDVSFASSVDLGSLAGMMKQQKTVFPHIILPQFEGNNSARYETLDPSSAMDRIISNFLTNLGEPRRTNRAA